MWMIFSLIAIIFALLNLYTFIVDKDPKWFRFISLSFTTLTICACYNDATRRIIDDDITGAMDVMPTMNHILWILVIMSILINSISLFKKWQK